MLLQTILAIVLLANIRKYLRSNNTLRGWDRLIIAGIICYIILLFLGGNNNTGTFWPYTTILNYLLSVSLIYFIFTKPIFSSLKSLVYAFLPLFVFSFIEDLLQIINKSLYKEWSTYFDTADFFGLIWMIAMLFISNKQKKAIEKERQKAEEQTKEFKITEQLKVQLEIQVKERTAEITRQKEELQKTLYELESTQSQLIQSEKMASLGELTAGIAHEIQNPLNFVNNFSEVSRELLDEMQDALEKGDIEDAKEIARDVIQNLERINHHGKRADAIVKGMLQHARTSSGQKELTDINALCDEYLRLSFHGLRAKDKSFNAAFKTDFDASLPEINIVPQDIGRVILNLINNAFYAVTERKQQHEQGYEPMVWVSTRKENDIVLITIKDNGSGIAQNIIDKIFQPFFTTKPAGSGTGLGLSLSYDIVTKGHGGELTVVSEENSGTTFLIKLRP